MSRLTAPIIGGLLALTVAALAAGGAFAGDDGMRLIEARAPKHLWSTINICDTQRHPDQLGIRARMPGNGTKQKMWMRFFAQYQRKGAWVSVPGAMSSWRRAGSAAYEWAERGWTFQIDDLDPGDGFQMRGLVKFQWRKHGEVLREKHAYTSAGHATSDGDPKGYSAATCFMSGDALNK